jgi:hypothetical protein
MRERDPDAIDLEYELLVVRRRPRQGAAAELA